MLQGGEKRLQDSLTQLHWVRWLSIGRGTCRTHMDEPILVTAWAARHPLRDRRCELREEVAGQPVIETPSDRDGAFALGSCVT